MLRTAYSQKMGSASHEGERIRRKRGTKPGSITTDSTYIWRVASVFGLALKLENPT
jgi:hypothetical protein